MHHCSSQSILSTTTFWQHYHHCTTIAITTGTCAYTHHNVYFQYIIYHLHDIHRHINDSFTFHHHRVCPCVCRYKKTLKQLLEEKPKSVEHLLRALEEAIELHEVCSPE